MRRVSVVLLLLAALFCFQQNSRAGWLPLVKAGGGAFTPASLTGLIGWYKADTGVTTSSGNVTAVVNQATPGTNDLANTGTVPFDATGLNSLPAFSFFPGNNAVLASSSFPMGTGTTGSVCAAAQMASSTASFGGLAGYGIGAGNDYDVTTSAAWLSRDASNNNIETTRNSFNLALQAVATSTTFRICSVFDGANNTIYLNGTAGTPVANSNAWGTNGTFVIGNRYIGGAPNGGNGWEGPVGEVFVGTGNWTSNMASINSYFAGRGF